MWERKPRRGGVLRKASCWGERAPRVEQRGSCCRGGGNQDSTERREHPLFGGHCFWKPHAGPGPAALVQLGGFGNTELSGGALRLPRAVCQGWAITAQTSHWPTPNRDWEEPLTTPVVSPWCKITPETEGWLQKPKASRLVHGAAEIHRLLKESGPSEVGLFALETWALTKT